MAHTSALNAAIHELIHAAYQVEAFRRVGRRGDGNDTRAMDRLRRATRTLKEVIRNEHVLSER